MADFDSPSDMEEPIRDSSSSNQTQPPPLSEKDYVQENYRKNPEPFWIWFCIFTILAGIFWGSASYIHDLYSQQYVGKPFQQVTNREFSLFLWQNPEFMRANSKTKQGYLPGFQYQGRVGMDVSAADDLVSVPPETLFLYHTWNRLLASEFIETPIPLEEFKEFLDELPEWNPQNWKQAPQEYVDFIQKLSSEKKTNLQSLPTTTIPLQVRMAFQGWKNFFKDKDAINRLKIPVAELKEFIKQHPHYARPFWQNIVQASHPNYLKSLARKNEGNMPEDELTAFLRLAFFNYTKSKNGS